MSHVEPFRVGDVEIAVLCQGWAPLPLADESPGHDVDWAEERRAFPWAFAGDAHWQWHVQAFIVRTPSGVTMVDTGLGGNRPVAPWAPGEGLTAEQAYEDAGVDPSEVSTVVLTHMHPDHSGGIRGSDGDPRFANARHVLHPADWAFLAGELSEFSVLARPGLRRVHELGMLDLDEGNREVAPGIEVRHTPGHTPGHRSVLVHGGDEVILLTDTVNLGSCALYERLGFRAVTDHILLELLPTDLRATAVPWSKTLIPVTFNARAR